MCAGLSKDSRPFARLLGASEHEGVATIGERRCGDYCVVIYGKHAGQRPVWRKARRAAKRDGRIVDIF